MVVLKDPAPANLIAAATSRTQISLVWADNMSNEAGFKIERSTDGKTFTQIATVGANVKTYSNTALNANTIYHYRVCAFDSTTNTTYSNTASTKTLK
jgi:titin